jgi:DNA-binding transcriptional MerR regulator
MEESALRLETTYDMDELVRESDRLRRSLSSEYKGLRTKKETQRNVHYYVQEGLIAHPTRRGKLTVYAEDALDRLVFIRILQATTQFGLKEIREYMATLSGRKIRSVARGDEQLQVKAWPRRSKSKVSVPDGAVSTVDVEQFGRLSESFAAMARQFAETASEFAALAESHSAQHRIK